MFKLIKKHYLVIILALVVGSLTCFPQIFAAKKVENFQGIYKTINNDETYYMARAKDVIDGHPFLSNPYLYEYKSGYPVEVWLPEYILAKPLTVFNIDLHKGYIFYDFLLPFILVILTYSILFLLTGSIFASFFGAAFLHLNLFWFQFNRNPSPQFNFIFWLLLYFVWLKFLKKSNLFYTISLGIFFGLLFHVYTYYWTFYVVFFSIFLFLNFIFKRPCPYKKYFLAFGIALFISIPYFYFLIRGMSLPYYAETVRRIGMIDTHFPSGRKIIMWGVIMLALLLISYKNKILKIGSRPILLLSGILASMISVNQHVITGKNLQFSSHYWMLSAFCFIFALTYLLTLWLPKIKYRYVKIGILILLAVYVFYRPCTYMKMAIAGELVSYRQTEIDNQRYATILSWLNKNTSPDEVVFANNKISSLVPSYTGNNVFYFGMAGLFLMPDLEFQKRFILNHYWNEIDETFAIDNKFGIWGAYYQTKYDHEQTKNRIRKLFFLPNQEYIKIPQEKIDSFLKLSEEVKAKDFEEQIKKYRVDYFVWDKENDSNWLVENLEFLEPIYEVNNMAVYKIK